MRNQAPLAQTFAELTRTVLNKDFDHIDPSKARVLLIEGSPRVLAAFPPELSASAQRQLEKLGVEVRTGVRVEAIRQGEIVAGGETIRADNIIWGAGVAGAPIARQLGVETDRAGRGGCTRLSSADGSDEGCLLPLRTGLTHTCD